MAPIFFIITTSLIENNFEARKSKYIYNISNLIKLLKEYHNIKLIIVENNGKRSTFLDMFEGDCSILYTDNNSLDTSNYGLKELFDVLECIKHFEIKDDDYVVKMTGRYYLDDTCPFLDELLQLNNTNYDAIIKYGDWGNQIMVKVEGCVLGIICLRSKYITKIERTFKVDCLEFRWARATLDIPNEKICFMQKLGIYMDPLKTGYFLV